MINLGREENKLRLYLVAEREWSEIMCDENIVLANIGTLFLTVIGLAKWFTSFWMYACVLTYVVEWCCVD